MIKLCKDQLTKFSKLINFENICFWTPKSNLLKLSIYQKFVSIIIYEI